MTEQEWLECTDPGPMLEFLKGKASDRKLRLFAVACYWRIWNLMDDKPISRKTLEFAERFADGLATRNELHGRAWGKVGSVFEVVQRKAWDAADGSALNVAEWVKDSVLRLDNDLFEEWLDAFNSAWPRYHLGEAVRIANWTMPVEWVAKGKSAWIEERNGQSKILHDIFGNPFRPVTINPSWLTPTVSRLTATAYEERALPSGELDTAHLAMLADALEAAACTNSEILAHCRGPGPHVRGCWVVDAVLGKE